MRVLARKGAVIGAVGFALVPSAWRRSTRATAATRAARLKAPPAWS